jgi:hypothetical protein
MPRTQLFRGRHFYTLLLTICIICGQRLLGESAVADEAEVRALMLYNLTKFVEWPPSKFPDPDAAFTFCTFGNDPVTSKLQSLLRGRPVKGRSASVHSVKTLAQAADCNILYIGKLKNERNIGSLVDLGSSAVLTVSDQHLSRDGIVVGLPFVENRILIEVDLALAQRSSISISSKLLRIAAVTR